MNDLNDILNTIKKPARYTGGEWNSIIKDWTSTDIKVALAYPDVYEIGMSNLGLSILYHLINKEPYALAERVYTPWTDMQDEMKKASIPLFSLETKHKLKDFDVIGFSLGYELTYTNVLTMLDLAGIPTRSMDRDYSDPVIIAGGTCAFNPEPMADFVDLFVIGDGEEVILEILKDMRSFRKECGNDRMGLLKHLTKIPGVYVPCCYDVRYKDDKTVATITPNFSGGPPVITRRIIDELPHIITKPVVPYIATVHDRAMIEIQRGCTRGCRFCQAGIVYRPVRERKCDEIMNGISELLLNTGYNEVSLLSLSTSDYSNVEDLISKISRKYSDSCLKISLPSLRIDSFSVNLMNAITTGKKTGLTFAPEAGSERLRRVINKNLTKDVIIEVLSIACRHGWNSVKLYFMLGLPGETEEDIEAITSLTNSIGWDAVKQSGHRLNIKISASTFVPKPHTPFQWVGQITQEEMNERIDTLRLSLKKSGARLTWQDSRVSFLEAALSRGDRRLSKVIYTAWKLGAGFDAWKEKFKYDVWIQAFNECSLDPVFYANRQRSFDEVLPWSHINTGISTAFLKQEYIYSTKETATEDCRFGRCNSCGLEQLQAKCSTML